MKNNKDERKGMNKTNKAIAIDMDGMEYEITLFSHDFKKDLGFEYMDDNMGFGWGDNEVYLSGYGCMYLQ